MIQLKLVGKEDKEILQNLFEYYVYEFSPYLNIDVSSNGRFGFMGLDNYFINNAYFPYFILKQDKYVGFCIVEKTNAADYEYRIDQFFILKRYEGMGFGKTAAFEIFKQYKGVWKITQIENNYRAQAFWRGTIKAYTGNNFREYYDENRRSVQCFHS